MHCQMQDPFEDRQYIKMYIEFRIYNILYNGYIIEHALKRFITINLLSIL